MQDNDPQNTSCAAQQFYVNAGIIWWHTPPEFPDMNLIKNIGLLKDYSLGSKNKEQGMANDFTMYVPVLEYYWFEKMPSIHKNVLLSAVIEKQGIATGY